MTENDEPDVLQFAEWDFFARARNIKSELSAPFPSVYGEISIVRDANMEISVTARWECGEDEDCAPKRITAAIGSRIPLVELVLSDQYGSVARLKGVSQLVSHRTIYGPRTQYECSTSADTVIWNWRPVERASRGQITESLMGIPDHAGRDLWPDSSSSTTCVERRRVRRCDGRPTVEYTEHKRARSEGRDHIAFKIDGMICRIGAQPTEEGRHSPGFLEFDGTPDEPLRNRVRQCLSLIFGRPLIRIHETEHSNGKIVEHRAISPRGWLSLSETRAYPPAPLHKSGHYIERDCFQSVLDALLRNWSSLNLDLYTWNLWNARGCPPALGCAFTHAAIEAIMKSFYKSPNNTRRTTLIAKDRFRELKKGLLDALPQHEGTDSDTVKAMSVIRNKIDQLNVCPQSLQMERLFVDLTLDIGGAERAAMRHRNAAAHGGESPDYRTARDHFDALQVLAARVLLAATSARDYYWDYTLPDYPPRRLNVAAGTVGTVEGGRG